MQTEINPGSIEFSMPEMTSLSAEFVGEVHFFGARILKELNKVKQLTAPKKSFFRDTITRVKDIVVRQNACLVYLWGKPHRGLILSLVRDRSK